MEVGLAALLISGGGGWAGAEPAPFGAVGAVTGGFKRRWQLGSSRLLLPWGFGFSFPVPLSLPSEETISTATSNLRALPRSCSAVPRTLGRMKLLGAALVALALLLPGAWGSEASRTCIFQRLSESEHGFCRGGLEVIYPEVGDVSCSYIPKCQGYRQKLSQEWDKPLVRFPWAKKNKKYVLVMVDPDAPNRANPQHRFWRHWLVTDILGSDMRVGRIKGKVLTDYSRPRPSRYSGYHRYQFRLYRQPTHQNISLSPEEQDSLGTWDLKDFVEDFHLGHPVASTQFLTKNYKD